jgi:hypothetical protein
LDLFDAAARDRASSIDPGTVTVSSTLSDPMPNGLHPDLMTAAERLDEIAEILAAGVLRARKKLRGEDRRDRVRLDFSPDRSMHADRSRRRRKRDALR